MADETELPEVAPAEPGTAPEQYANKSLRETINGSIAELEAHSDSESREPPRTGETLSGRGIAGDSETGLETQRKDATSDSESGGTPPVADVAPASWKREAKEAWGSLPETVRSRVYEREREATREAHELKTRYQELDEAVRPFGETIQSSGRSAGSVVRQLLDWEAALKGPDKAEAFRRLATTYGVDPATLADDFPPTGEESRGEVNPALQSALGQLGERVQTFEQQYALERQTEAERHVAQWARDKPHFEAVRGLMSDMIQNEHQLALQGYPANRLVKNGMIDIDAAYEAAIWAHPETRAKLLAEERAKERLSSGAARNPAIVAKARQAGSSLRAGAPVSGQLGSASAQQPRRESVRDTLRRALSERS